jgi:hypothetical protein
MPFATGLRGTLVNEPQHALFQKAAGFRANDRTVNIGLATSFRDRFGKQQHHRPNDSVLLWDWIGEFQAELMVREALRHGSSSLVSGVRVACLI